MQKIISVQNTKHSIIAKRVKWCASFLCRLRGFTFRRSLQPDEGLVLVQKKDSRLDASIHMVFVFTNLSIFWIDSNNTIVDKCLAKSWRLGYFPRRSARYVLELHPDRINDLEIGETIIFTHE